MEGHWAEGWEAREGRPASLLCMAVCIYADPVRRASSMRRRISRAKSDELNSSDNNILYEIPGHEWTKFAAREMI